MTIETNMSVTFESSASTFFGDTYSLSMYQPSLDSRHKYASYSDIQKMINYAKTGNTAFTVLKDNPYSKIVGDNVQISLDFFVRPNPEGLSYSLSLNNGVIKAKNIANVQYNDVVPIPMTDTIRFPGKVAISSVEWLSPVYDHNGGAIVAPSYTVSDNSLVFDKDIFAVIRLKYTVTEHKYTAVAAIPKTKSDEVTKAINETYSVTDITPIIIGTYIDENGESQVETLTLEIPPIVADFLSKCPEEPGLLVVDGWDEELDTLTLYYSTCDGEVLDQRKQGPSYD